jgi:hypothetical protein
MLWHLSGSLNSLLACGIARYEDEPGMISLQVSQHDAVSGGFATISLYVDVKRADGGTERALFSAWIAVPPGVDAGEVLAPSVELPGALTPVRFRVRLSPAAR